MKLLPENKDERRMFDEGVKAIGDGNPMKYIAATLFIWHRMAPEGGSHRETLAIMYNEVVRQINEQSKEPVK